MHFQAQRGQRSPRHEPKTSLRGDGRAPRGLASTVLAACGALWLLGLGYIWGWRGAAALGLASGAGSSAALRNSAAAAAGVSASATALAAAAIADLDDGQKPRGSARDKCAAAGGDARRARGDGYSDLIRGVGSVCIDKLVENDAGTRGGSQCSSTARF